MCWVSKVVLFTLYHSSLLLSVGIIVNFGAPNEIHFTANMNLNARKNPAKSENKQIDVLMSMHDDEKCTRNEMKLAPAPAKNFLPTCPWCRWMLSTLCIQSFYRVRTDDYEFLISSKHDTNRILKMMPPNDGCAIVLITENLRKIIDEKIGTRFNSFTMFWFLGLLIERSEDEKLSELRSMINGLTIVCVCWASSEWFSGMIRAGIREEIPEIATQKF